MRRIFTYLLLVLFSVGSLQAGTHYCVGMDTQDMPDTSMSDTSLMKTNILVILVVTMIVVHV